MSVFDDFDGIMNYAHFWNWAPNWNVVKEIYEKAPDGRLRLITDCLCLSIISQLK